ncbi:odorant receptor 49b-like [Photinus pyralis]|uniref:odorant receptor 49b-like n=1 Tax=Photinus pyralis TaxID=7054 RepID=UPI001266F531|nr:odorant receptor 49b-like [Photinus pyralis]
MRNQIRKNCIFFPKYLLRCLGINFYENESVSYKIYSFIAIILIVSYPWNSLHSIYHHLDNFDLMINGCFNMFGAVSATFKALTMLYHRGIFRKVLRTIADAQEEQNVYRTTQGYIYRLNKIVICGSLCYYLFLGLLYMISLYGRLTLPCEEWRTPILDVTLLNITYSPNYEVAYVYEVLSVYLVSSIVCFSNVLITTILIDMTVQFKLFRNCIRNNFKSLNDQNKSWTILQRFLKDIVERHLSLIDLMQQIEMACSKLVLIDVLANLLIICFSCYYASVLPLFDSKAFQAYFEVVVVSLSQFSMSYFGTQLSVASQSIADTCYELDFIGTDIRFQKGLLIVMRRSVKPLYITVGGFSMLSITVFVMIMKNSYSFLMVLRSTNNLA